MSNSGKSVKIAAKIAKATMLAYMSLVLIIDWIL